MTSNSQIAQGSLSIAGGRTGDTGVCRGPLPVLGGTHIPMGQDPIAEVGETSVFHLL